MLTIHQLTRTLDGEALPDIQLDAVISQTMQDVANAEKLRGFGGDPR
jgi:hypothetical protein